MNPVDLPTYVPYGDGIDPSTLNLGDMVLNIKSPEEYEPYRPPQLCTKNIQDWTVALGMDDAIMSCIQDEGGFTGMTNFRLLDVPSSSRYVLVVAKTGSRIEIPEPQKFLNEVILKTKSARHWLSSVLAISMKLRRLHRLTYPHPHIWLLTGLLNLTDANSLSIFQRKHSYGSPISVPLPDPSGVTALLRAKPQLKGRITSRVYKPGNKIYAAQWQRVNVAFPPSEQCKLRLPNLVRLAHVFSERALCGNSTMAEVSVEAPTAEPVADTYRDEFDDNYWRQFLEDKEDIVYEISLPVSY